MSEPKINADLYLCVVVLHFNAGGWMKIPKNVPNCSPGLECLSLLDQLLIKQGVCLTQGQTYKFVVKNNQGQGVSTTLY